MSGLHWLLLFGGILLAWAALFAMSVPENLRDAGALYGADFWVSLCTMTPDAAGAGKMALMWVLMSAAMMAPTALPALRTYDDLGHVTSTGFGKLVGGYLGAWLGFSLVAAAAQVALFRAGLIGTLGQSLSVPLTALLLLGAGAYQFTEMKAACLSRCRAPLTFFIQHWEEGPFRNGLQLGLDCVGCCWALMLLAFIGGTMNLAFMGLAMVLMTLEKLPDIGRYLTKPLGLALIAAGFALPLF